jgi:PhoD-like phosphatase
MAHLILGPLLRYAGEREATVWVETDSACTVGVLDCSEPTFEIAGHHYALVHCEGLEPGTVTPYTVTLDGELAWPDAAAGFPDSVIRTPEPGGPVSILFGSCRVCAPHVPPHSLRKDESAEGREVDSLRGVAMRMRTQAPQEWPHALVMLGDQVYADEVSPGTKEFIRGRRDTDVPPYETVADFEEYTRLYREAWSEPYVRWLLSTVPTAMIFDDHDVHDDWNTSLEWVTEMRATGWWDERIIGGFMTYWLYQHLGNLAPAELASNELYASVRDPGQDAEQLLRDFAFRADREVEGTRWSFCRDIGPARLVMLDSRAGRVLAPGRRQMVDDEEFRWIEEHARGDVDHLLLGTSLPLMLAPGMHYLEAWNEAVCDGAWGLVGARIGEKIRQGLDLEHWAAFRDSFDRMAGLLEAVARGQRGRAPASIVTLSGDVHHAYLAEVAFRRDPQAPPLASAVWQAVCSPFRNPLDGRERRVIRFATSRAGTVAGRALARLAGVPDPEARWRFVHDAPWFDNQVGTLELAGLRLEKTLPTEGTELRLETVFERSLA